MNDLARRIDDALPQTQCTRCGFPDCSSYAQAIAAGEAAINQCPPGGQEGVERLAALTGQAVADLNPANGIEGPVTLAVIDENWCIGCTLCIKACPTDAIVGSHKLMHTVIEPFCTGCELCLPVCPVDCIDLEVVSGERSGWAAWTPAQAELARQRYDARKVRLVREKAEHEARLEAKARMKLADLSAHSQHTDPAVLDKKRAVIEAALARARERRGQG
jgi:Na+-translocating ferredoxin:NAD+ oxidoreductase subunit B